MLKAARLQALTRIVSTAPSVAALEKLEQHFAGDWAHVSDEAAHRRLQLDLLDSQAEEALVAQAGQVARGTASEEAPMFQTSESGDLGGPGLNAAAPANPDASSPVPPDTLDFGDIPYHEAVE